MKNWFKKIVFCIGLFLGLNVVFFSVNVQKVSAVSSRTKIHIITPSVGYGTNSILLESNGHFGMVDSGEDSDYPSGDNSKYPLRSGIVLSAGIETEVIAYMKSVGVTADNFDFYIGTHPHSDHIGSADEIIEQFCPKRVYIMEYKDSYISSEFNLWDNLYVYDNMLAAAKSAGASIIQNFSTSAPIEPKSGSTVGNPNFTLGSMKIEILNYNTDYKTTPKRDANYFSLCVKVTANGNVAYLCGDMVNSDGDETALLNAGKIQKTALLVLGHYGYNVPSSAFYNALKADNIVTCGRYAILQEENLTRARSAKSSCRYFPVGDYNNQYDAIVFDFSGNTVTVNVSDDVFIYYKDSSHSYCYKNGCLYKANGLVEAYALRQGSGKNTYFVDSNGKVVQSAWKTVNGDRYYFGSAGVMLRNTIVDGYFIGEDGKVYEPELANLEDGYYWISTSLNRSQCVEIASASTANKANVQLYQWSGKPSQQFKVEAVGNGYYKITNVNSGKVLDVEAGSIALKTNVQQYSFNGTAAQLWRFVVVSENEVYIQSKLMTFMDCKDGKSVNGTNIQTYLGNKNAAQKFTFQLLTSIESCTVDAIADQYVTGIAVKPDMVVRNGDTVLQKDKDYTVTYSNNVKAGTATVKITGIGDYAGSLIKNFKIVEYPTTTVEENVYSIVMATDSSFVMDVDAGSVSNKANIQLYKWNGTDAQRFKIVHVKDNYYKIVNMKSGKVLDVTAGFTAMGTNVQQYTWNGTDAQLWCFIDTGKGDGSYYIHSKLGGYLELKDGALQNKQNIYINSLTKTDKQRFVLKEIVNLSKVQVSEIEDQYATGAAVKPAVTVKYGDTELKQGTDYSVTYTNNIKTGTAAAKISGQGGYIGSVTKSFKIVDYPTVAIGEAIYRIVMATDSSYVMDVDAGSLSNKANIQLYKWNGTDAQKFKIVHVKDNYYKIVNVKSGKVLDVTAGSSTMGTNVQQYTWNGTDAQLWSFIDTGKGDGSYYIHSKLGGYLELKDGTPKNKQNIYINSLTKTDKQRFVLKEIVNLSKVQVNEIEDQYVTGTVVKPAVTVKYGDSELKQGTDYTVSYTNNIKTGTATARITGQGCYIGSVTKNFKIVDYPTVAIEEATYGIAIAADSNYVIDVDAGSLNNKANIQLYKWNATDAQKFKIVHVKDNYYKIVNVKSGKVLDVTAGSSTMGTNVQQYTWNGTDAQLWSFVDTGKGDGSYYIHSKLGGYLELKEGTLKNRQNIQVNSLTKADKQRFVLKEIINMSEVQVLPIDDQYMTGTEIKPEITVKYKDTVLKQGTDYTVTYKNNIQAGTATVQITGKGFCIGNTTIQFKIAEQPIATADMLAEDEKTVNQNAIDQPADEEGKNADLQDVTVEQNTSSQETAPREDEAVQEETEVQVTPSGQTVVDWEETLAE